MKAVWLHKNKSTALIIFCNGWGMDEHPFKFLDSQKYDVLTLYDYRDIDEGIDLDTLCNRYEKISLVGWSMGVWAGQVMFGNEREMFDRVVAVNGTLAPIDDKFGIPVEIFEKTYKNFDKKASLKFYRRMCGGKENFDRFVANQSQRSIADRREELGFLLKYVKDITADQSIYTDVVIADKDFIMPTRNQIKFWQNINIRHLRGHHFLFYRWQSWDDILEEGKSL